MKTQYDYKSLFILLAVINIIMALSYLLSNGISLKEVFAAIFGITAIILIMMGLIRLNEWWDSL